jgi:hypothetical protein
MNSIRTIEMSDDDFIVQLNKKVTPLFGLEEEAPDYRQETQKKKELSIETFEDDIVLL